MDWDRSTFLYQIWVARWSLFDGFLVTVSSSLLTIVIVAGQQHGDNFVVVHRGLRCKTGRSLPSGLKQAPCHQSFLFKIMDLGKFAGQATDTGRHKLTRFGPAASIVLHHAGLAARLEGQAQRLRPLRADRSGLEPPQ